MIGQTLAIFHDAYRELNARKMFWIVLALSGVVVLAIGSLGLKDEKVTILWWRTPIEMPIDKATFYKVMFSGIGINLWLTIGAAILAVISTASIFPDFISGGSIDLYLSKPISRLRLFLTKYATGLLFVALQVLVFSTASFLVIGIRGGSWQPRLFLAVPLVVCFFSYLFGISTLLGVVTRSTIGAVLLTVLAWFLIWCVDQGDAGLLMAMSRHDREVARARSSPELKVVEGQIDYLEKQPAEQREESREMLENLKTRRAQIQESRGGDGRQTLETIHRVVLGVKTALPKTRETADLLTRYLISTEELGQGDDGFDDGGPAPGGGPFSNRDVQKLQQTMRKRPVSWVIGTSLLFELVLVSLAAWVFCRRDY